MTENEGQTNQAQRGWALARNHLVRTWLTDLHTFCRMVLEQREGSPYYPLFWIRLHGAIVDLPPLIANASHEINRLSNTTNQGAIPISKEDQLRLLSACLDRLMSLLSSEDRIVIAYHRHTEAHPWVSGIHVGFGPKAKLQTQIQIPGIAQRLDRAEVERLLDRRVMRYVRAGSSNAGHSLAIGYADRLKDEIKGLQLSAMLVFGT